MAFNSSEKEKFFAKSIPISINDEFTNQTRTRHLYLTMEWQDSSPTKYSRKVLVQTLTDNDDPFFLYSLHLSEEDFQTLKESLKLKINFAAFPQHIINFIERCLQEEKNPQPRYVLAFTVGSSSPHLDFIETLELRDLKHMSLKFVAATETAVKQYLTSFFRSLKEENRQLKNKLTFLEQDSTDKLAAFQSRLSSKEQELEHLRREMSAQLSEKDAQHLSNLHEERNQLIARHKEEESRLEEEKESLKHNFKEQIERLELRISYFETLNKDLEDRNRKLESSIKDQKSKILSMSNEVKKLNETIRGLERKCEKLKLELEKKEEAISDLKDQLCDTERESQNRAMKILKLEDEIDLNEKQVKNLKIEVENLNLQLEVGERQVKVIDEDKRELEKVVRKLQGKLEEAKAKCEHNARYKVTVEEKEELLQDLRKEAAQLSMNLEAKNVEVQTLNNKIDIFQGKINALEDDLNTNQNVIKFLNTELTKNHIIPQYTPPQGLDLSPSSVAQKELAKIDSGSHRKSLGSPTTATHNPSQKSVRIDRSIPSTVRRNSSSTTPARYHDSAYYTSPSNFTDDHATPREVQDYNFNGENGGIDPDALSGAFGEGDRILKHSTAKKSTKPVRSIAQKTTKKR